MFILFENLTFSLVSVKYDFCMEPEQFKREKSDFKVTDHRISVKVSLCVQLYITGFAYCEYQRAKGNVSYSQCSMLADN